MEYVLIKIDSDTWNHIWDWLAAHPVNEGLAEPSLAINEDQAWQYTGSYKSGDKIISSFRHLNHPITNMIYNVSYVHTAKVEDIEKKVRI